MFAPISPGTLMYNTTMAVITTDIYGSILACNEPAQKLLKYDLTNGLLHFSAFTSHCFQEFDSPADKMPDSGLCSTYSLPLTCLDGSQTLMQIIFCPMVKEEVKSGYWLLLLPLTNDHLPHIEALEYMLNGTPNHLILFDTQGRHVYLNTPALEGMQLPKEGIIGKNWRCLPVPEEQGLYLDYCLQEVLSTGNTFVFEAQYPTKGEMRNWFCSFTPIRNTHDQIEYILASNVDITYRKKIEQDLQKSASLINRITQTSPNGIIVYDLLENTFVFSTPRLKEITGYSPEELQLHPQLWEDLLSEKDRVLLATKIDQLRVLPDEETLFMEHRIRTKTGEHKWLRTHLKTFLRTSTGHISQLLFITSDISLQEEAKEESRKSLQLMQSIFDSSFDALFLVDPETDLIIDCNPKALILFEANAKTQLVGLKGNLFLEPPFSQAEIDKINWLVKHTGNYSCEIECKTVLNNTFYGSLAISKINQSQNRIFNLVRVTDITEKIRQQQQVELSEQRYKQLVNGVRDAVFIHSFLPNGLPGNYIEVNEIACQLLGYTQEELLQLSPLAVDAPEMQEKHPAIIQSIKQYGHALFESVLLAKGGHHIPVEIQTSIIYINGVATALSLVRDISGRKKWEKELIEAKTQAEAASHAKQQFLSTMTHELRTPMNAVIGMTNLLLENDPLPRQVENLNILKFSSENLLNLINDILDFSKIEAGKITLEENDFDLKKLLKSIQHSFVAKSVDKGIKLNFRIDTAIPEILCGDSVRLMQVLNNLVSNAIKFTTSGRVIMDATLENELPDSVTLHFSVVDTGIGINEKQLTSIFESFTQASSDTTRLFGGTGLGLAITKRLLELMGSQIQVSSQPGKGSCFSFILTLKKSFRKKAAKKPAPRPIQKLPLVKVLLVEDNPINQIVARKFLHSWDIDVDTADNGLIAFQKLKQAPSLYDLILMDLHMPEMNGYESTRAIRSLKGAYYKKVPIIALTADAFSVVKNKTIEAGMNGFVTKPFNPEELYRVLSNCLTTSRKLKENLVNETVGNMHTETDQPLLSMHKIREICGKDLLMEDKILTSSLLLIDEFKEKYRHALLEKDANTFHHITHKIKTMLLMFELHELAKEIKHGEHLLTSGETSNKLLHISVNKVNTLCLLITKEIKKQIDCLNVNNT